MRGSFHIKLLHLHSAIRGLSPFTAITAEEDESLRELICRWHAGEEIAVSDVMRSLGGVSQTTAFRRVMALRDHGMVSLRVSDRDKRVKFVEPTALSQDYARRLAEAFAGLDKSA